MGWSASATIATTAVSLSAGLLFATVFARRTNDRDAAILALLAFAVAEQGIGDLVREQVFHAALTESGETIQWVGFIAAYVLLVHFSVRFAQIRGRGALLVAYAVGTLFEGLALAHRLNVVQPLRAGAASAPSLAPLAYAAGFVAVAATLVITVRAYMQGRREALSLVLGESALLATTLIDLGASGGLFHSPHAGEFGQLAFICGGVSMLGARYTTALKLADRRGAEVRQKGREVQKLREELTRAEEELGRKEQLAVVGELAAVIAHEVRNPLAIMGNAVAGLRKNTLSREDHGTLLSILEEETSRLNRLVTDLLRYARPVNIQRTNISLNDFIERTLSLLKARKNVTTVFSPAESDGRVWADANLLRQVFDNLFDNAVQAMGPAGTLTVRIRTASEDGVDGFAVSILDTGEGMDTLVRSRAKDPFFTTRPSGTGLGLAIVDRIVDAHGGRFVLDSHAGEGTTVTVFLPYGSSSEPPPRPKSSRRGASDPAPPPSSKKPRSTPPATGQT